MQNLLIYAAFKVSTIAAGYFIFIKWAWHVLAIACYVAISYLRNYRIVQKHLRDKTFTVVSIRGKIFAVV